MAQPKYKCRIPKNKRRIITVGDRYEYCVKGFISIFIRNIRTDKRYTWHMEVKPKWRVSITPIEIRNLIETGELVGIRMTQNT